MKCLFDTFAALANGTVAKPYEVFDNLPALIARNPKTLADFARKHADEFRY
jgi:NAD(P)H dehydrogenase (quinone)